MRRYRTIISLSPTRKYNFVLTAEALKKHENEKEMKTFPLLLYTFTIQA